MFTFNYNWRTLQLRNKNVNTLHDVTYEQKYK